jgi:hypothetical protein
LSGPSGEAGSRFLRHTHQGGEEVVLIAGRIAIGGVYLEAGDHWIRPLARTMTSWR